MRRRALAAGVAILVLAAAACGGGDSGDGGGSGDTLTVYSGREEEIVAPLLRAFEEQSGVPLDIRYGDSAELAATIAEEGDSSPADVFFAQDVGSLGAVAGEGLLAELPQESLERVDERFRDPEGRWVGTSGRVRVIAYNTDALSESEVPTSVLALTDPAWKGKLGIAPTNASFQAFVSAMRLELGDEQTREWLEGIVANDPKLYEKNSQILEALAAGEIELGLVNHYYLALLREQQPDAPVANFYLPGTDPGALVNAAGVGILAGSDRVPEAEEFVAFLLSDEGQRFYAEEAAESEYPLVAGIEPKQGMPPLDSLQGPEISLGDLGPELEPTLQLLNEVGLTS